MRRSLQIMTGVGAMALATTTGGIAYLYESWKARAVVETRRLALPLYAANGLRHSLAAADTYAAMRWLGLPIFPAARLVERLGQLNEQKEFYLRPLRRRDPTREIYKDLYNNAVGIFAAVKMEGEGQTSSIQRLDFLGRMTERKVVLHVFTDPRVPDFPEGHRPESSDLALALGTFKRDRTRIYGPIIAALSAGKRPD